ncbi:hypothetical protein BDZ45DRAFT_655255 [Acephala macrosclerotiorum]|nr:hypothetical protein BDZ45DRAFT_655255 [Acephala macrosclerotiorum]
MWSVDIDPEQPFVYSIFGLQYKDNKPNEFQQGHIDAFDKLISPSAKYIENIIQEDATSGTKTKIWLAYWKSMPSYQDWWKRSDVVDFWTSLPIDAGMYREVLTVPRGRTQIGLSAEKEEGMAYVGTMKPMDTTKMGYWGCYRDRYEDGGKKDLLPSSLESPPEAQKSTGIIRPGRVLMTTFPDNLCFVVEGQDHSNISAEEKNHWFENFDTSVTNWINDLTAAPPSAGILDKRLCYVPESGKYRDSSPDVLNYNRKVQLFYFLDHGYMERIGKMNKGHVNLRNNFLQSYCPTGAMGQIAKLLLWVETSVVKSNEIECEYVGCLEGTGFMAYDHHSAFKGKGGAGLLDYLKGWVPGS